MKRPSKASGKGAKTRRIAASKPKRVSAQSNKSLPNSSAAGATGEIARLTRELNEALERQAATSQVLEVISGSPGDLQAVFVAVLENAVRLCDANFGMLWQCEGKGFRCIALHNAPSAFSDDLQKQPVVYPPPGSGLRILAETRQVIHVADLAAMPTYTQQRAPAIVSAVELGGVRTYVAVPMLKSNELIGALIVYRQEVRRFSEKQIDLVKNFAAQAVIAIENARLLNELRQRTEDLSEALEQQTGTSEVLRVISSSPGDLKPVFETMLASAAQICDAHLGGIYRWDGEFAQLVATTPVVRPAYAAVVRYSPFRPDPKSLIGRSVVRTTAVQFSDFTADELYTKQRDPFVVATVELGGFRTGLFVPMLKENEPIGFLALVREDVRLFTDKQIDLVKNFAAQAVIAIENARLLNELREALEQQTATADVLKVISSSPGELQPVFDAMLEKAVRICQADAATLFLYENGVVRRAARHTGVANVVMPITPSAKSGTMRSITTKQIIHIADYLASPAYLEGDDYVVAGVERLGIRSSLHVPMLREADVVGTFTIWRTEARAFTEKQIELVANFAAQAVIAIENARLLNELRQRTDDLTRSLEDLRTTQDRLVQTQKLASLGQLTAGIAHEIKNPLNFVNNFSGVSVELIDELQKSLQRVQADDGTRSEIGELADTLRDNLDKIVQHGKRADAIVKSMLLHSGESSGEHRSTDINALVDESLTRAYYNARAEQRGFTIKLERSLDPAAGKVEVFPREITRALLNLISNGFYAATKRKAEATGDEHEPMLVAATKNLGDHVEIRIRDNGSGIPPEVREKMFNPFFTTKPAGEGTGLGLSIAHDIIVKQHSGLIEVDSQPGGYTEVRIVLPRTASFIAGGRA